jgi:tetratricopeptide (TPR) repeat protein
MLITVLIQTNRFFTADQLFTQAKTTNYLEQKEQLLIRASEMDPNNLNNMTGLYSVYISQLKTNYNIEYQNKAEQLLDKMLKTEPGNANVLIQNARFHEQTGNDKKALAYYNAAMDVDHFNSLLYQEIINLKVKMAIDDRNHNNLSKANSLVISALKDYKTEKSRYGKIDHTLAGKVINSRDFQITTTAKYYAAIAYYLKKDYSEIIYISKQASAKDKQYDNLLALRILAYEKLGQKYPLIDQQNLTNKIENLRNYLN